MPPVKSIGTRSLLHFSIFLLLGLFVVCLLISWGKEASHEALWMDEVLAVWTARMPTVHDVFSAPFQGSDFSPPTYHLLLHFLITVFGGSYLILRTPSVLAALISGLCVFGLLKRYAGIASAALGMVLCLLGILSSYTVEARPYTLVVACFAVATVLWDRLESRRSNAWRVGGITILLSLATSLHFYAVLLIPCLALMELLWSLIYRRLRLSVWLGLIAAGTSSLLWLPLIRAINRFNTGDTASMEYYAKPILARLGVTYMDLFMHGRRAPTVLLVLLCLAVFVYALSGTRWFAALPHFSDDKLQVPSLMNLYIIAFGTLAFPAIVFAFSRIITKTFNARYCVVACLGISIVTAYVIGQIPRFKLIAAPLLLFSCVIALRPTELIGVQTFSPDFLEKLPKPYPIVVAEGLQYLQFVEAAPEQLKRRLVYVTTPPGATNSDPTNENQVKRWLPLRPELKITDSTAFFSQNPHFYLLSTPTSPDVFTDWLLEKKLLGKPVTHDGYAWVYEAEAPQ